MQSVDLIPLILEKMRVETATGRSVIPMAALCKRLDIRMSTLQRHLTAMADFDIVQVHCDETGRWTTSFTTQGLAFYSAAQAA